MLVLSRKRDELIIIDGQISIKVLEVRGNRVRLGIEAPAEVPIRRAEIEPFATVGAREMLGNALTA